MVRSSRGSDRARMIRTNRFVPAVPGRQSRPSLVVLALVVGFQAASEVVEGSAYHADVALHHELVDVGAVGRLVTDRGGREHHDRAGRVYLLQTACDREPPAPGEHEVDDGSVNVTGGRRLDGLSQVGRRVALPGGR